MRTLYLVLVALLAPSPAAAQATAADGIKALAAGDAATALRILRPLAEASPPDPLAQFFLASMYETGSGVRADPIRACGLYLNSATPANPFASQATAIVDEFKSMSHPIATTLCESSRVGVWREPLPATFVLGTNHRVTIDVSGFTVSYRGTDRKIATDWGGVEWVFLPTKYTRLEATRPTSATRHFIEFWVWMPDAVPNATEWALCWSAYEVVGAEAHSLWNTGAIAHVNAASPPEVSGAAFGRLQVNAQGEVERVILGPNSQTDVIPPRSSP